MTLQLPVGHVMTSHKSNSPLQAEMAAAVFLALTPDVGQEADENCKLGLPKPDKNIQAD